MTEKQDKNIERWLSIIIGAIAIVAIKSIFEDDNSKIVSKKGRKILSDIDKMNDLNLKIEESENGNDQNEIYI